jgi:GDPmannose 4,6-dehydratase
VNYRESFDMFCSNGILFNHESPRRGKTFVTRKITLGVGKYKKSKESLISLGNLDAIRDWGFAGDYVEAMWKMLQKDQPNDYVIATGRGCTVRDFATLAFAVAGVEIEWLGNELNEKAVDKHTGRTVIVIDPKYYRPAEVDYLLGDSTKARKELKWEPETDLENLVEMMVLSDIEQQK